MTDLWHRLALLLAAESERALAAEERLEHVTRERDEARAQLAAVDTGSPCDGHRHCCADRRKLAEELLRVRAERDEAREGRDLARERLENAIQSATRYAVERDEARAKYEMLYEEADRALRAPLLALSAIVGGDAFFAPGPWDSQTQGINALAERITRSFAIWRDRAAKQLTQDFERGAEAMRFACQQWCRAWENDGTAIADALADLRVEDKP